MGIESSERMTILTQRSVGMCSNPLLGVCKPLPNTSNPSGRPKNRGSSSPHQGSAINIRSLVTETTAGREVGNDRDSICDAGTWLGVGIESGCSKRLVLRYKVVSSLDT